jgi:ribonuclease T1
MSLSAFHALKRCALALVMLALAAPLFARVWLPEVGLAQLPIEARHTLATIKSGGPFAHARDGIVFGNREKRLPTQPYGYYFEYTVPTPGEATRGARRIVAGRGTMGDVRTSGEYWYSDDHYQSFKRIRE